MPEIALFEFQEQWGGQAATWTRLHKPDCYIYADYYGVAIAGAWDNMSVDERRALASVFKSAAHYHQQRVKATEKPDEPTLDSGAGVWTGQHYSD